MTPSEIAAVTRMKITVVEALERDDYSNIAAPIYAKGFIKLYAEAVGLNPEHLINEYMSRFAQSYTPPVKLSPPPDQPVRIPDEDIPAEKPEPLKTEPQKQTPPSPPPTSKKNRVTAPEDDLFSHVRAMDNEPAINTPRKEKTGPSALDILKKKAKSLFNRPARQRPSSPEKSKPAPKKIEMPPEAGHYHTVGRIEFFESPSKFLGLILIFCVILILLFSALSRLFKGGNEEEMDNGIIGNGELRLAVEPPSPYFE